jgi:prevent-host-death family protein
MNKVRLTKAKASLAEYTRALSNGPLVVTSHGRPIAALVPVEGLDWESFCGGANPCFLDLIEQSRRRLEKRESEGIISLEAMDLELAGKSKKRKHKAVS